MRLSACGRFLVVDTLHIDREVLGGLARWGERRGLRIQDAIQIALIGFMELTRDRGDTRSAHVAIPALPRVAPSVDGPG